MPPLSNPDCRLCPLWETSRTVCVPGVGPLDAPVLFLTDHPDAAETADGRMMAGEPGRFAMEAIRAAGLTADPLSVRVEALVKCRPPGGRKATADEVSACSVYRQRTMASMPNLVLVVPWGENASRAMGMKGPMLKRAGIPIQTDIPDFMSFEEGPSHAEEGAAPCAGGEAEGGPVGGGGPPGLEASEGCRKGSDSGGDRPGEVEEGGGGGVGQGVPPHPASPASPTPTT